MNKKLIKALSIFVIAGAIGTGAAIGLVGCNNKPDDTGKQEQTDSVTSVTAQASKTTATVGEEVTLTATVKGTGTFSQDVTWAVTSGNGTISNGKLTATAAGVVKVQATSVTDTTKKSAELTITFEAQKYEIPAAADSLIVEGYGETEVQLSTTVTSHSIDKSAIKVYFNDGANGAKGTEVPAENLVIGIKDPESHDCEWSGLKMDGAYKISVSLKDVKVAQGSSAVVEDFISNPTVTVKNKVVANSLAVKTGGTAVFTQKRSIQNKIVPTWTYEVTRENGEKEDVTVDVSVSGMVTTVVTAEATANLSCTIKDAAITGTVTYSITENAALHTKSYAASFGSYYDSDNDPREGDDAVYNTSGDTPVKKPGGVATGTKFIDVTGTTLTMMADKADMKQKVQPNSIKSEEYGKFFPKRFTFDGGSFTSKDLSQANRYLKLDVDGPSRLTIYYSVSGANRGVAVYDDSIPFDAITIGEEGTETIAKSTAPETNKVYKLETELGEAGSYFITTATKDSVYFHYIQVDTEFEQENGADIPLAAGENKAWDIELSKPETIPALKVGSTFTPAITKISKVLSNSVSCAMSTEDATDWATAATYKMGSTAITAETVITEAMLGKQTITVIYGEFEASYDVTVEAAVDGITGISVSDNLASKQVAAADGTIALTKNNVVVDLVGTNAAAQVTEYSVKVDGTALTDSVNLKVGKHTVEVTATVTAGTASATFTATHTITITVKPAEGELQDLTHKVMATNWGTVANSAKVVTPIELEGGVITYMTDVKRSDSSKNVNEIATDSRAQVGSFGADGKNSIKINLAAAAKITIGYENKADDSTDKSGARVPAIYKADGTKVADLAAHQTTGDAAYEYHQFDTTFEAGEYYLASTGKSINIVWITIDYTGNDAA